MHIAIVGGGISGLAAAWELQKQDQATSALYEKNAWVGGSIQTAELGGVRVEQGADSFLARLPEGVELCQELGIDELVSPVSSKVLLKTKTGLEEFIQPHILGIPTEPDTVNQYVGDATIAQQIQNDLVADIARSQSGGEIKEPDSSQDTVGAFIRRRVGDTIYMRQVAPLLGAISASDPDLLSLPISTPMFVAAVKSSPSLVKGLLDLQTSTSPKDSPAFYAPKSGMGTIISKLNVELKDIIQTNAPVERLDDLDVDATILAIPAFRASQLLAESGFTDLPSISLLKEIEFASVAMIQLVFKAQLPEQFQKVAGVLVERDLGLAITAISFSTQKWGGRSRKEVVRISIGSYGNDEIVYKSDEEIYSIIKKELEAEFEIQFQPVASRISRWEKSFPQYFVSHAEKIDAIKTELAERRIYLAGSSLNGVGIGACIASGKQAAVEAMSA